jgi:hypothetical protein
MVGWLETRKLLDFHGFWYFISPYNFLKFRYLKQIISRKFNIFTLNFFITKPGKVLRYNKGWILLLPWQVSVFPGSQYCCHKQSIIGLSSAGHQWAVDGSTVPCIWLPAGYHWRCMPRSPVALDVAQGFVRGKGSGLRAANERQQSATYVLSY